MSTDDVGERQIRLERVKRLGRCLRHFSIRGLAPLDGAAAPCGLEVVCGAPCYASQMRAVPPDREQVMLRPIVHREHDPPAGWRPGGSGLLSGSIGDAAKVLPTRAHRVDVETTPSIG